MGGMGKKGDSIMYELIDEAEFRKYRTDCSAVLTETCSLLKEQGISAQFTLVAHL